MTPPPSGLTSPERLFHLTHPANADGIRAQGLLGTPYVFFSETREHCEVFVGWRLSPRDPVMEERVLDPAPDSLREDVAAGRVPFGRIDEHGRVVLSFAQPQPTSEAVLVVVDTTLLDPADLEPSTDHSPLAFGGASSWMHLGDVPPGAIVEMTTISLYEDRRLP